MNNGEYFVPQCSHMLNIKHSNLSNSTFKSKQTLDVTKFSNDSSKISILILVHRSAAFERRSIVTKQYVKLFSHLFSISFSPAFWQVIRCVTIRQRWLLRPWLTLTAWTFMTNVNMGKTPCANVPYLYVDKNSHISGNSLTITQEQKKTSFNFVCKVSPSVIFPCLKKASSYEFFIFFLINIFCFGNWLQNQW